MNQALLLMDLQLEISPRNASFSMCGIATSGVVLSTLRHAADADYECTVLEDAGADGDDEVHRVLTQKVFPRQATVVATADFR